MLFWFTVIHSMSTFFTSIDFHNVFFLFTMIYLGIVFNSGSIGAFLKL